MAKKLNPKETVDLKELLMSEVIQTVALTNLLDRKDIIFDVTVSNKQSNEPAVTTRLIELINNLSESQQQALLTTLVDLVEKAEAYYLNFLKWKKRVDFQPAYAEVHLVSEKYQFGHYLIECNIKAITPDNIEHTEERQRPQRRERPRKSCLMVVDYATLDRAYRDCIRNISASGLFIETRTSFSIGQKITLTFSASNYERPIKITGKIARTASGGIGVKFKTENQDLEAMIKSL
jgi:Tfp pilus assembly protein PilZ